MCCLQRLLPHTACCTHSQISEKQKTDIFVLQPFWHESQFFDSVVVNQSSVCMQHVSWAKEYAE